MHQFKYTFFISLMVFIMSLSACSSSNVGQSDVRNLPTIPEIKRPIVTRSNIPPKKAIKKTAVVKRYSPGASVQSVITKEEQRAVNELLKTKVIKKEQVVIDPYASIPDNSSMVSASINKETVIANPENSPAVKSLMTQARADIAIGNTRSAISSIERGLRIEPENSMLWNMLAITHFEQSEFQQTISMAKKSIRYSNNDNLIAKNWELIKKAGEKVGDMTVVKEAINYSRVAP
jgi:predicted Zn-dependent protease